MKAAYILQPGPPEGIVYGHLPQPEPKAGEVLVRVGAVSLNPIDTYVRSGLVTFPAPKPFILGCDLAGTVEAVGNDVTRYKPGDRVWGSNQGLMGRQGTFAEFATVEERWLYPTPNGVNDVQAAAMALVGITAHLGLFRHAHLRCGETIFVQGGSGGVGSAVLQMAKIAGARVISTAGNDAKAQLCRELGADEVIVRTTQQVEAAVKDFAPKGVDVWWETLREPDLDRAVRLLAPAGRLILMAGREARPVFPVGPFYVKDCSVHGFAMFNASPEDQAACASDIARWLATGRLLARIDRELPLSATQEAHRLQEDSTVRKSGALSGKIVLRP